MTARLDELAARRRTLVAQSDALRDTLALSARSLKSTLTFFDIGVAFGRSLGRQPLLLVGIVTALVVLRPRRIVRGLSVALTAASVFRQVVRLFTARRPQRAPRIETVYEDRAN